MHAPIEEIKIIYPLINREDLCRNGDAPPRFPSNCGPRWSECLLISIEEILPCYQLDRALGDPKSRLRRDGVEIIYVAAGHRTEDTQMVPTL
jgi:hypothetical protein